MKSVFAVSMMLTLAACNPGDEDLPLAGKSGMLAAATRPDAAMDDAGGSDDTQNEPMGGGGQDDPPEAGTADAPSDSAGATSEPPRQGAKAFALLPDTQFYACAYPEIFSKQTQFLRDEKDTFGLGIVLHTGDIVDTATPEQWEVAANSLHILDGALPYLLVPGNHDVNTSRDTALNDYFTPEDVSTDEVAVQMREDGHLDNAFAIVKLRGKPWLFLGLEFAPRDKVLEWAAGVLAAHEDLPTVIFTHAYLYSDGERYDRRITPLQPYHPDSYPITPEQGIGDGEDIWNALVEPYEQVRLVLSGHVIPDGVARSVIHRESGSVVHQVLTNYQQCGACPCAEVEGGNGYLRIFELDEDGQTFSVTTYSPYLEASLSDEENWFELSW